MRLLLLLVMSTFARLSRAMRMRWLGEGSPTPLWVSEACLGPMTWGAQNSAADGCQWPAADAGQGSADADAG